MRAKHRLGLALLVLASASALMTAPSQGIPRQGVPRFQHVVVVVFENHRQREIIGNPDAPTFNSLARRYAGLSSYFAISHPSLPNYLALVSGSTHGITTDCTTCSVDALSLADTLAAAGLTWKTYAEGLPSAGFAGASFGRYAKKHDPFLYFDDVAQRADRRARIVPFSALHTDIQAGRLPSFALVVPDLCNDMHDCPVATGDRWLRREIAPLLSAPALAHSVVFVVFDEGTGDGSSIPALVLGPLVRPGSNSRRPTGHYGLLRTIEAAWGLPALGHSKNASPITGIWRTG